MAKKTSSLIEADARDYTKAVLGCTGKDSDPISAYQVGYGRGYDDGHKSGVDEATEIGGTLDSMPPTPQELATMKIVKDAIMVNGYGHNTKQPCSLPKIRQKVLMVTSIPDLTLTKHLNKGWLIKMVSPMRMDSKGEYEKHTTITHLVILEKVTLVPASSSTTQIGICNG